MRRRASVHPLYKNCSMPTTTFIETKYATYERGNGILFYGYYDLCSSARDKVLQIIKMGKLKQFIIIV